jgi:hypothetical protein
MNSILKSENRKNVTNELLQSEEWMRFQEAAGRHVVRLRGDEWSANGVVHRLLVVGEYLYVPRGPRSVSREQITDNRGDEFLNNSQLSISNDQKGTGSGNRNQESGIIGEGSGINTTKHSLQIPNRAQDTNHETRNPEHGIRTETVMEALIVKAKDVRSGWIRIEPETEGVLSEIREATHT